MRWTILLVLLIVSHSSCAQELLKIPLGHTETLRVSGLKRVVVSDTRLIRAKYLPPDTVLLTALRVGLTNLRFWDERGELAAREVQVTSNALGAPFSERAGPGLVRVSLDFLEVDSQFSQQLGVKWPDALRFGGSGVVSGTAMTTGLNYSVTFGSTQGWVSHLVKQGWGKVLAQPEISVRLGEEAMFHSGGEFPVPSTSETFGRSRQHVDWKGYGITVRVRPESIDEWNFRSDIHVEISEINRALQVENVPGINRRKFDTKIQSRDGESVLLTGLVRRSEGSSHQGVPGLSKIPLVGIFFKEESDQKEETELLLSVTVGFSSRGRDEIRRQKFSQRWEQDD